MPDHLYYPAYARLVARFERLGVHPRRCFWRLPKQWAKYRRPQLTAMRRAIRGLTSVETDVQSTHS